MSDGCFQADTVHPYGNEQSAPYPPFASLVEGGEPLAVEGVRKNTPSVSYADSSLSEGALVHL